jgi:type IV pilus assembly protein PilM
MSAFDRLQALLQDPPPEFAFEITVDGIAMSRTRPPATVQFAALPHGVIVPSPLKDNVQDAAAFAAVVAGLVPAASGRGRRTAALILPDNSMRVAIVDFATLPDKEEERLALIKFRLRKTLPFDIDEAALSYYVQPGNKVLAAVAPVEIIARYEAPFRAAGLHPGLVTSSSVAMLELLPVKGSLLVAHLSRGALTVIALDNGVVSLARSLELAHGSADPLEEISADIYPTLVYIEDQTGARPEQVLIAGFGDDADAAATRLAVELDIAVHPLPGSHLGLSGYLQSLSSSSSSPRPARPKPSRKAAA